MPQTILLGDDDVDFCRLMELFLSAAGFRLLVVHDGHALVRLAQEELPDLLLVDLVMPQLDGYEALRQLRNDTRTAHLPMIILTARVASNDIVSGFESGADDFVTKPVTADELIARIRGHLRRAARRPVNNPLTGLAGNTLLTEQIRYRMRREFPFALLHIDLSSFKAFNDSYGFARGDRVIHLLADVLRTLLPPDGGHGAFLGHIGGDDFAVLGPPAAAEELCRRAIARFDARVTDLYDAVDIERGFLESLDRDGAPRRFPIVGLVIGGVVCGPGRFQAPEELGRAAAAMKQRAKLRGASAYVIDPGAGLDPLTGPAPTL
jgi:diguanylate cyclase (GGDEF)-like protein